MVVKEKDQACYRLSSDDQHDDNNNHYNIFQLPAALPITTE